MGEYIITDEQIAENRRLHGNKLLVMPVIVRCRDCIFYAVDNLGGYCTQMDFQVADGMEDGFCAWGERKENGR